MSDIKDYKEALAGLMRDTSQAGRDAFAQVLVEFLEPNHLATDLMGRLLKSRSLTAGDVLVKKVRRGIKVHTLVPGSVHLAHELTINDRINFILDGADVKVTYNEWELQRGEIGSVESITSEMRANLQDFYVQKVFTMLTNIWTAINTPNNFTAVGGPVTAPVLINAINRINITTPGAKAIVGVRSAVTPITAFGSFFADPAGAWHRSDERLNTVLEDGWLGKYYGVPVIALDQVWNNPVDYQTMMPTDKVLVIGESVGEFITYGETMTKQWTDMNPTPPQWMLELYQQFGLIVDNAEGIFVLGNIV